MPDQSAVQRAFLDALAAGESDALAKREGISPYFILCGGGSFEHLPDRPGFFRFPEWDGWLPDGAPERERSHAAGRGQLEPLTWREQAIKLGLDNFRDPAQQDIAAWDLAASVYRSLTLRDLEQDLQSDRLDSVAPMLRSTWISLGPSFPSRFHAALIPGAHKPAPSAPAPPGPPLPTIADIVRDLQRRLAAAGFYHGQPDGDFGPMSYEAIQDYQAQTV